MDGILPMGIETFLSILKGIQAHDIALRGLLPWRSTPLKFEEGLAPLRQSRMRKFLQLPAVPSLVAAGSRGS